MLIISGLPLSIENVLMIGGQLLEGGLATPLRGYELSLK